MITSPTLNAMMILALKFAIVDCGRPRLNVCPESFHLTWQDIPPYTEIINDTAKGILFRVFETGMRPCCIERPYQPPTPFILSKYALEQVMVNESTAKFVQFMLPVQRNREARNYLGHPYVPIISSPGFALFVKPRDNSIGILLEALKPVLPMFIITVFAVAIAGVIFWMIETVATVCDGGTPEPFNPGVWNGVWWAFISMMTIGYGDIVPKTKAGKAFSVIWVLAGIVLSSVVISTIAAVLIGALSPREVSLVNENVAVLHDSEEGRFSFKNQGISHRYSNVAEISEALETDVVTIAVVDVLIAARNNEIFKDFVLDRIIEQETNRGVVFLPEGVKFASCFNEYVLNSQREIIDTVSNIIKGSSYKSYRPISSSSIIDPSVPAVQYTLLGMLTFFFFIVACGLCKERLQVCLAPRTDNSLNDEQELSLLKESKENYLCAVIEFLGVLRKNCHDEMERSRRSDELMDAFAES